MLYGMVMEATLVLSVMRLKFQSSINFGNFQCLGEGYFSPENLDQLVSLLCSFFTVACYGIDL